MIRPAPQTFLSNKMFTKSPFTMAMMYLKPMGFWAFALLKGLTSVVVLKVERWQIYLVLNIIVKNNFLYLDHYNPRGAVLLKE